MGIISSAISSAQQAASVARQERFQRETMQNRYQWQVADMRAAGLNPALSYGASAPGGASGAPMNPKIDFNLREEIQSAKQMAALLKKTKAELTKTEAETGLIDENRRGAEIANDINEAKRPAKVLQENVMSDIMNQLNHLWTYGKSSAKQYMRDNRPNRKPVRSPTSAKLRHQRQYDFERWEREPGWGVRHKGLYPYEYPKKHRRKNRRRD